MTRLNLVVKNTATAGPWEQEVFTLPIEAVPTILGALWLRSQKYWWQSADEHNGRRLMVNAAIGVLMPSGQDIVDATNRVYTLLGGTLLGRVYSYTGTGTRTDPYIYDPPLPPAVDATDYTDESLLWAIQQTAGNTYLLKNAIPAGGFADNADLNARASELLAALNAQAGQGSLDPDMLAELVQIAALLA